MNMRGSSDTHAMTISDLKIPKPDEHTILVTFTDTLAAKIHVMPETIELLQKYKGAQFSFSWDLPAGGSIRAAFSFHEEASNEE